MYLRYICYFSINFTILQGIIDVALVEPNFVFNIDDISKARTAIQILCFCDSIFYISARIKRKQIPNGLPSTDANSSEIHLIQVFNDIFPDTEDFLEFVERDRFDCKKRKST